MRNQKGKKIGLHMLTAALFFVLAMSVCTVKTEAKDYKQGKVYKITAKSKPLKASKFTKSSLYNKKTRMYFTIRSYMEKFQKKGKGTLILKRERTLLPIPFMCHRMLRLFLKRALKL